MTKTATTRRRPAMTPTGRAGSGGSAALKLAIVGPTHPVKGVVAAQTTSLAHALAEAGHDVTLVSWSHPFPGGRSRRDRGDRGDRRDRRDWSGSPRTAGASEDPEAPETSEARETSEAPVVAAFPRTVHALSWSRPDTWVRTGRRLRGFDAIVVVPATAREVPAHLSILRSADTPRSIVIADNVLPPGPRPGDRTLMRSLFERVDAVLVHSQEHARHATHLHATRVSVADFVMAHEVGAIEALASPQVQAVDHDPPDVPSTSSTSSVSSTSGASGASGMFGEGAVSARPSRRTRWASAARPSRRTRWASAARPSPMVALARLSTAAKQAARRRSLSLSLTRKDLPDWVRPSDVLGDRADADDGRDWARTFGLPRCTDPIAAWAALGALAAIVRLGDDGQRTAVIVDGSGQRSPLSKWARAIGFAPVALDFAGGAASTAVLEVDTASLDVITRLHPHGCDSSDVDEALRQATWALRSGGVISLTLPLGPAGAEGAVGPADVRALLARADELGFVLVGDLDGEMATMMRSASEGARRTDAAYGLVLLTFRRR